jgi:hypothetical protein
MDRKLILIVLIFLILSSPAFAERKYIYNESFEEILGGKRPVLGRDPDGIKYWMRWTDKNNEQSAQFARTGKYSFKVIGDGGIYQDFAGGVINPNETYQISAYAFIPQGQSLIGGSYAVVKLEWLNSAKRLLVKDVIESIRVDNSTQKGQWVLIEVESKPPDAARFARATIEYRCQGKRTGPIYWDDVNVRALSNFQAGDADGKDKELKPEVLPPAAGEEIDWQW